MGVRMMTCAAGLSVLGAGAAAQPFVHQVGEGSAASERGRDLIVLEPSGNLVALTATALPPTFASLTGITLLDSNGVPQRSWLVDNAATPGSDPAMSVRQDPADGQLIVMQQSTQGNGPDFVDLFKFDQSAGSIAWQWSYPIATRFRALGLELDGDLGYVAGGFEEAASNDNVQPALMVFDTATGLPVLHERYELFDRPEARALLIDVVPAPGGDAIFAVGTASRLGVAGFAPDVANVIVARFDAAGSPVWFNAYDVVFPGFDGVDAEGQSIAFNDAGDVVINGTTDTPGGDAATFTMVLDAGTGGPLASSVITVNNRSVRPADSNLELLPDGSLLSAGTTVNSLSNQAPAMWSVDPVTATLNWLYVPSDIGGIGFAAQPQQGGGLILFGDAFAFASGTFIGGLAADFVVARTNTSGQGLCPDEPAVIERNPLIEVAALEVETIGVREPEKAMLGVVEGDPDFAAVCDPPCLGDTNGDGLVTALDISNVLSNFGATDVSGPSQGDLDGDGNVTALDISIVLSNFGNVCP